MKHRKHSDSHKVKVVNDYLGGLSQSQILEKYQIGNSTLQRWVKKLREFGEFPDGRGKSRTGRPRKVRREDMTDSEYIEYLEMQLEIKKYMAFYEKRKQK